MVIRAKFVWRMEDILDLYAEPYDAAYPMVCFDEIPGMVHFCQKISGHF
jgi:hypothetical protein